MDLRFQNILWPTDFSPLSLAAAGHVRRLVELFGARLHLLHIAPVLVQDSAAALQSGGDMHVSTVDLRGIAHQRLQQVVDEHFGAELPVTMEVRVGSPWREICEYAREAAVDLIVSSTHGHTGFKHVLLGSVAERVVQHAHCPVLVLKSFGPAAEAPGGASSATAPRKVLWPTDFSDYSLQAADYAEGLKRLFDAELYVLHVHAASDATPVDAAPPLVLEPARTRLDRIVEELYDNDPHVHREVLTGVAWEQVCEFAGRQGIDLIVLSTHGRTGLRRVLLGSVTERIVQHAPCHVLVVRSTDDSAT